MKKKVLSALLVAAMSVSVLAGCGSKADNNTDAKNDASQENKNASGQDHGFTRMSGGGAWRIADLSAIHRVRGSRCKCAAARLWKYTLERRKGSSGREWIYWHFYGRI